MLPSGLAQSPCVMIFLLLLLPVLVLLPLPFPITITCHTSISVPVPVPVRIPTLVPISIPMNYYAWRHTRPNVITRPSLERTCDITPKMYYLTLAPPPVPSPSLSKGSRLLGKLLEYSKKLGCRSAMSRLPLSRPNSVPPTPASSTLRHQVCEQKREHPPFPSYPTLCTNLCLACSALEAPSPGALSLHSQSMIMPLARLPYTPCPCSR